MGSSPRSTELPAVEILVEIVAHRFYEKLSFLGAVRGVAVLLGSILLKTDQLKDVNEGLKPLLRVEVEIIRASEFAQIQGNWVTKKYT
jgi:hypothetical protein